MKTRSQTMRTMRNTMLAVGVAVMAMLGSSALAQTSIAVHLGTAMLSWQWMQGAGGAVTEFHVKCGTSSGAYTTTKVYADPTVRTVAVKDFVSAVGTYFCVVAAANAFGKSAASNEVTFSAGTVPVAPSGVAIHS